MNCGCSDEDEMREMDKRWSPCHGDRGSLLLCDMASSEPYDSLKENEQCRLNHEIPL